MFLMFDGIYVYIYVCMYACIYELFRRLSFKLLRKMQVERNKMLMFLLNSAYIGLSFLIGSCKCGLTHKDLFYLQKNSRLGNRSFVSATVKAGMEGSQSVNEKAQKYVGMHFILL